MIASSPIASVSIASFDGVVLVVNDVTLADSFDVLDSWSSERVEIKLVDLTVSDTFELNDNWLVNYLPTGSEQDASFVDDIIPVQDVWVSKHLVITGVTATVILKLKLLNIELTIKG